MYKKNWVLSVVLCVILGLLSGCANSRSVVVDAITAKDFAPNDKSGETYALQAKDPTKSQDLHFEQFSRAVSNTLREAQLCVTDDNTASCIVLIDYSVKGPYSYSITRSVPIMGYVGDDIHTYQTIEHGVPTFHSVAHSRYGTIGWNTYQDIQTYFVHEIELMSVEQKDTKKHTLGKTKWQINVSSADASNDFTLVAPSLLTVLREYLATDTHGQKKVEVVNHKGVLKIEE